MKVILILMNHVMRTAIAWHSLDLYSYVNFNSSTYTVASEIFEQNKLLCIRSTKPFVFKLIRLAHGVAFSVKVAILSFSNNNKWTKIQLPGYQDNICLKKVCPVFILRNTLILNVLSHVVYTALNSFIGIFVKWRSN